jgi:hypothetical protein
MNHLPPTPENNMGYFKFCRKFTEIFASQGAPPVSTKTVQILPPVPLVLFATGIDNTSGKFVTGVNDTGDK